MEAETARCGAFQQIMVKQRADAVLGIRLGLPGQSGGGCYRDIGARNTTEKPEMRCCADVSSWYERSNVAKTCCLSRRCGPGGCGDGRVPRSGRRPVRSPPLIRPAATLMASGRPPHSRAASAILAFSSSVPAPINRRNSRNASSAARGSRSRTRFPGHAACWREITIIRQSPCAGRIVWTCCGPDTSSSTITARRWAISARQSLARSPAFSGISAAGSPAV